MKRERSSCNWEEIYEKYLSRVRACVAARFPEMTREDIEDVVQETFFGAWKNWDSFCARNGADLGTWLTRIACNKAVDNYRVDRSRPAQMLSGRLADESCVVSPRQEIVRHVMAQMEAIDAGAADILRNRYVYGVSVDEMAAELKLTRRMAEVGITNARRLFVDLVQKMD